MAGFDYSLLATITPARFAGPAYRNQAPGFDPISGEGARRQGGRFNPPHSFPVIYLCATRPCVVAELTAQATRQGCASPICCRENCGSSTSISVRSSIWVIRQCGAHWVSR
jgi:RES domain-containing protein